MSESDSKVLPFPAITKQRAVRIAAHASGLGAKEFSCYSELPPHCKPVTSLPLSLCWYVYAAPQHTPFVHRDSRLLIVSRENGSILYDGPAGDGA